MFMGKDVQRLWLKICVVCVKYAKEINLYFKILGEGIWSGEIFYSI